MKIALPATSATFDFGDNDFYNYFIQLYTPAQSTAEGLDLYYEFGERYAIGNAGTVNAFHQGMLQNQSADLVTPATFELLKGDDYYRYRTINTGGDLNYIITAGERSAGRHTLGVQFSDTTFSDPNVTTGDSPLDNLTGWTFADSSRAIITMDVASGLYTFRAKGTIVVNFNSSDSFSWFFQDNAGNITYMITPRLVESGSHTFTFDCTFQLDSSDFISVLGWSEGDFSNFHWYSQSDMKITIQNPYTVGIIDEHFSDFFQSKVNSNGRAWIVDPDAAQVYNPSLLRWGLANIVNTNINQTNRFYPLNYDEIDRSKGDIWAIVARERIARIFQSRGVGQVGVYNKFIKQSDGTQVLSTTDEIITKNNINYYQGDYGLGDQRTGLVSTTSVDYFVYPSTGDQIRLSRDGMTVITDLYKGQYFIKNLLTPYNKEWARTQGGKAKILGAFDYFEGRYVCVLQGGVNGIDNIESNTFSFHEGRNGYDCFFDLNPEWIISAEDKLFAWNNGQLYALDNEDKYGFFFGVQYYPSIQLIFNDKVAIRKTFNALSYQGNQYWVSDTNGEVFTSVSNEFTRVIQESQLKQRDYTQRGNYFDGAFLRDANSMSNTQLALLEGDYLEGQYISVNFTYKGYGPSYFFQPYVNWQPNNRNF